MADQYGPVFSRGHQNDSDSNDGSIGPALPPGFKPANQKQFSTEADVIGPALPPGFKPSGDQQIETGASISIGPALPPGFQSADQEQATCSDEDNDSIGPVLPPGFKSSRHRPTEKSNSDSASASGDNEYNSIGPALPPGFKKCQSSATSVIKGPTMPPGGSQPARGGNSDSDEDDYIVGPSPAEMTRVTDRSLVAEEFERRAQNMKDKLDKTDDDTPLQRESWMMELPPEMGTNFGLSARKFRTNPSTRGGDRSGWTDTPADKARKEKDAAEGKGTKKSEENNPILSARDKKLAESVDKYNQNKRKESLLDMHEKDRKKKKVPTATLR